MVGCGSYGDGEPARRPARRQRTGATLSGGIALPDPFANRWSGPLLV